MEYVFAYGSLAAAGLPASGSDLPLVARLAHAVRVWDVAMDNRETVPGYKIYVDRVSGERPAVAVTFLNLAVAIGRVCTGVLVPLDAARIAELDRRERNYRRIDVSRRILCAEDLAGARIWTYRGSPAGRARYASGAAAGAAVVPRQYLERVEAGFASLGLLREYRASTRTPESPVVDLVRVDLVDAPG
ncbi:MAG TPA: hypothetical protein VFN48_10050 [Solirubrobacteraceae bacterium]|nr:hypothetical protein [Solirubrobacteraceae bacterium]